MVDDSVDNDDTHDPGEAGLAEATPSTTPPAQLMDHFEGVAFRRVDEAKHDELKVRLRPWRALNAKNNIFSLIVLFYGIEPMRELVDGDVDDYFLFDPIAWSWDANHMLWQEMDDVPARDLDGVQTMLEVNLPRAYNSCASLPIHSVHTQKRSHMGTNPHTRHARRMEIMVRVRPMMKATRAMRNMRTARAGTATLRRRTPLTLIPTPTPT
jgi:hypothetical protein